MLVEEQDSELISAEKPKKSENNQALTTTDIKTRLTLQKIKSAIARFMKKDKEDR